MIQVKGLSFTYSDADKAVLADLDLGVDEGQLVLLTGPTGCGKSTLMKTIIGLAPHFTGGTISGTIEVNGQVVVGKQPHDLAHLIGYVNQQPENAFATDTVEEELAFGMEQLGFAPEDMVERVRNIALTLDIVHLLKSPLESLSGGEQQRVAIGAAITAGQRVLLLDEPTSALDGQAATEVLKALKTLTREENVTVLISEHRADRVLPFADRVIELEREVENTSIAFDTRNADFTDLTPILKARDLTKDYGQHFALQPIDFEIMPGEVVAVIGDNGSGKSSLLWAILESAWEQSIEVAMVPQTAADLLFLNSVSKELEESVQLGGDGRAAEYLERLVGNLDLNRHPRDLSAGQQLALVLAMQVTKNTKLIILDEPTRGLDQRTRANLRSIIGDLAKIGHSVVFATHDHGFAESIASRSIELDRGFVV